MKRTAAVILATLAIAGIATADTYARHSTIGKVASDVALPFQAVSDAITAVL